MVINNKSLGKLSLAFDDIDDMILIEPTFIGSYILKIEILVGLNKIDKAYDLLLKSKEINPEFNSHYLEGLIYAAKNDKEKALKINKESGGYFALLGMKEEYIASILTPNSNAFVMYRAVSVKTRTDYILMINSEYYDWIKDDPRIQEFEKKEKEKYDMLQAKYGNLDFLDL